jgi:hypothetical protein
MIRSTIQAQYVEGFISLLSSAIDDWRVVARWGRAGRCVMWHLEWRALHIHVQNVGNGRGKSEVAHV